MDLRQIRYFITVASEKTFSRAASKLHMTQPPLSTSVANLEKEMGVSLFERTSQGVKLTEAGEYLYQAGTRLLQEAEEMERRLRGIGLGMEGHLSIASVPTFTWEFMPEILSKFSKLSPHVDIVLSDPPPETAINMLLRGWVDLSVVVTTNAENLREQYADEFSLLVVEKLPLVAVLPASYSHHPDPVDLTMLQDEQWIVPMRAPRFPGLPELIEDIWQNMRGIRPAVREVSTLQTAIPLIAAGLGVGLMPRSVRQIGHREIITREILQSIKPMEAAVLWRSKTKPAPVLQRFLDLIEGK